VEQRYGTQEADESFTIGQLAGMHFYEHLIGDVEDINGLFQRIQEVLKDLQIGIFRWRMQIPRKGFCGHCFEDIDCSGLPELDYEICSMIRFLAALFERFFEMRFQGKEIDCWCSGDRTMSF